MLNLENLEITDCTELDNCFVINALSESPKRTCSECNSSNTVIIGKVIQPYADTPTQGKAVKIKYNRKRLRCKECGKTSFESLDWLSNNFRMTQRAEDYVVSRCGKAPFLRIATELNITEGTVRNIFANHVAVSESNHDWLAPRVLSINEVQTNKKEHLVLIDAEQKTLLDLRKDRSLDTTQNAIMRLRGWQNIEIVTMGMWAPYRDAVTQLIPKAVIVVDYAHIAHMTAEIMTNALTATQAKLSNQERKKFKDSQKILLKRRANIATQSELEFLGWWADEYPTLMDTYDCIEALLTMWDTTTRSEAEQHWEHWNNALTPDMSNNFKKVIEAISNWHHEIFNYWDNPCSNTLPESLSDKLKDTFKNSNGNSFEVLRAELLYTQD
ncbi:ISL3 family transposase [Vibrio coralliirubri]|uniref:ISL3 family transposase n=1 Tax=Vibrio coralliirubri TaxID=1516159 RepID=UPI002284E5C8|nr:ISL3 family transposase [Vibrio coralliirubri]MCY9865104.1 ISL3 family transposase [Vibrio coralliirubri]